MLTQINKLHALKFGFSFFFKITLTATGLIFKTAILGYSVM